VEVLKVIISARHFEASQNEWIWLPLSTGCNHHKKKNSTEFSNQHVPHSWVLLEKLIVVALVKNFPALYENRRFQKRSPLDCVSRIQSAFS
jgi:hypothetical protein